MNTDKSNSSSELKIDVKPFGPSQETVTAISELVMKNKLVKKYLDGTSNRLLWFEFIDPDDEYSKNHNENSPPNHFRITFYDYTNNRTIFVKGILEEHDKPKIVDIEESNLQPLPNNEEFQEALQIFNQNKKNIDSLTNEQIQIYPPMPPLLNIELPDGTIQRTINLGLIASNNGINTDSNHENRLQLHEIVGINMIDQTIVRYENRAPSHSLARDSTCGLPYADQPTASGIAGQVWVTVKQGNTTIWKFLAVRPAASSGTNGSGVELRYVDYKGKRVLYRAHVPILNVKYNQDACGPYRDWQNEEGMIKANGSDIGSSGFRLCSSPATTILDTGSDLGNFLGVAIYVKGQEVILVSEMEAGWYRYISEWRLHANGTITPRFGFTAVNTSSCVCNTHHHHAYWRFDFDIHTASNNRVREYNDPPLAGSSKWHTIKYETKRFRDPSKKRKWRVEHIDRDKGYDIVPGSDDSIATSSPDWPFPRGDLWFLRYRGTEIDDGSIAVGPPYETELDRFINGESLKGKDVVVWYGGHFTHDVSSEPAGSHGHVVGPKLVPVNW
jgi:hypothetical protein